MSNYVTIYFEGVDFGVLFWKIKAWKWLIWVCSCTHYIPLGQKSKCLSKFNQRNICLIRKKKFWNSEQHFSRRWWNESYGELESTGMGFGSTWLRGVSAWAPGDGERQAGGEETSLLVPSSPDSSVTGERSVWQRPAVIWAQTCAARPKQNASEKRTDRGRRRRVNGWGNTKHRGGEQKA